MGNPGGKLTQSSEFFTVIEFLFKILIFRDIALHQNVVIGTDNRGRCYHKVDLTPFFCRCFNFIRRKYSLLCIFPFCHHKIFILGRNKLQKMPSPKFAA